MAERGSSPPRSQPDHRPLTPQGLMLPWNSRRGQSGGRAAGERIRRFVQITTDDISVFKRFFVLDK